MFIMRKGCRVTRGAAAAAVLLSIAGCKEENTFRPPPAPRVGVSVPAKQSFTRYFEATGTVSPVNTIDLVARVPGYVYEVKYTDGQPVRKGDELFVIEPAPYQAKLQQAQASLASATANLLQSDAELGRQSQLGASQFSSRSTVDQARAKRDMAAADVDKAKGDLQLAAINLSYTHVNAPFAGVASAKLVSVSDLVGAAGATKLASVVQLDPIYVTFNVGEGDVLQIRAAMARGGKSDVDLTQVPIEVGLANEQGYPHRGTLDYVSPGMDATTGTLMIRGLLGNADRVMLPGMFARMRVPLRREADALLVPDTALGTDLGGRYALVVNKDDVVEQRRVRIGPLVGGLRVVEEGLAADSRVVVSGNQRAVPNLKVAPEAAPIAPPA